jgi:hypothetical protein
MAIDGQSIEGVLPLFLIQSPFFGKFLATAPYLSYGSMLRRGEGGVGKGFAAERQTGQGMHVLNPKQDLHPIEQDSPARRGPFRVGPLRRGPAPAGLPRSWAGGSARSRPAVPLCPAGRAHRAVVCDTGAARHVYRRGGRPPNMTLPSDSPRSPPLSAPGPPPRPEMPLAIEVRGPGIMSFPYAGILGTWRPCLDREWVVSSEGV